MRRALGLGAGLAVIALVVGAVQGGTDPAPVAAALGQASPVTTAPVATTAPAPAPTTRAAPPSTVHNVPGRAKDAPGTSASRRTPTTTKAPTSVHYDSCADFHARTGRPEIHRGDPGYTSGPGGLDRDGDGAGCGGR